MGVCADRSGAGEGCVLCERSLIGLGINRLQRREGAGQGLPGWRGAAGRRRCTFVVLPSSNRFLEGCKVTGKDHIIDYVG